MHLNFLLKCLKFVLSKIIYKYFNLEKYLQEDEHSKWVNVVYRCQNNEVHCTLEHCYFGEWHTVLRRAGLCKSHGIIYHPSYSVHCLYRAKRFIVSFSEGIN